MKNRVRVENTFGEMKAKWQAIKGTWRHKRGLEPIAHLLVGELHNYQKRLRLENGLAAMTGAD
jgi:hypothetical protein